MTKGKRVMPAREVQLALGKRIHEGEFRTMSVAAAELGQADSRLYAMLRLYRDSIGFKSERQLIAEAGAIGRAPRGRGMKAQAKMIAAAAAASAEIAQPAPGLSPAEAQLEAKQAGDRARSARRRAEEKEQRLAARANRHAAPGRELVPFDNGAELDKLRARAESAEAERDWALGQLEIVNKLLMCAGAAL